MWVYIYMYMHILKCCRNQPKKFFSWNKGFYLYFLIYSIFSVSNNQSGIIPYFLGVCQVSQSCCSEPQEEQLFPAFAVWVRSGVRITAQSSLSATCWRNLSLLCPYSLGTGLWRSGAHTHSCIYLWINGDGWVESGTLLLRTVSLGRCDSGGDRRSIFFIIRISNTQCEAWTTLASGPVCVLRPAMTLALCFLKYWHSALRFNLIY